MQKKNYNKNEKRRENFIFDGKIWAVEIYNKAFMMSKSKFNLPNGKF